ncbi:VCBS domain-containing protein [Roseomonas sp. WA12]
MSWTEIDGPEEVLPYGTYVSTAKVVTIQTGFYGSGGGFSYGLLYTSYPRGQTISYYPDVETVILDQRPIGLFQGTALINDVAYLLNNRDVLLSGMDAEQHYLQFGWKEGRGTGSLFDAKFYLAQNPDVAASGLNPVEHYLSFGWKEGRDPTALFDTDFYLQSNADVAASGVNPFEHYLRYGSREGRDPNSLFDADFYLRNNDFVREIGGDPLTAYIQSPGSDATSAKFIATVYLDQNRDVAASGMNPLAHYIQYGRAEGRTIGSGIPAIITGPDTGTVREDGLSTVSGRLIVSDVDQAESPFVTSYTGFPGPLTGRYGNLQIDTSGFWTYRLDNEGSAQTLRGGEAVIESFTVRTLGYDEHTILVTVQGENDAALIGGGTEAVLSERAGRFAYGQLSISDADTDEAGFAAGPYGGTYGTLVLSGQGTWTYEFKGNASLNVTPGTTHSALEETVTVESLDGTEAILRVHIAAYSADAVV